MFGEMFGTTVDGSEIRRSPADMVNMVNIPLFTGFLQDFFHQQNFLKKTGWEWGWAPLDSPDKRQSTFQ